MSGQPDNDPVYARVCEIIRRLTRPTAPCSPGAHLIDDLGLDSLKFVDLTVELETAFGMDEFPMQAWLDERWEDGLPITLGALVEACRERLAPGAFGGAARES